MKKIILYLFLICSVLFSQEKMIYENRNFKVFSSKIIDNNYKAAVISNHSIISDYSPAFQEKFNRIISFKFSVNGSDNERKSGMDHKVFLNPMNGFFETPLFVFGEDDPVGSDMVQGTEYPLIPGDEIEVTFNVDMRKVLDEFELKGFFECYDGSKIYKSDFKGVYIAGGLEPLTWDFKILDKTEKYKLLDQDEDGIFELKINFLIEEPFIKDTNGNYIWKLTKDISNLPSYQSEYPILNSLYNLSLEEMLLDIRADGTYMAGAKWNGVWTRDISYSILLSLAIIQPDVCKTTLMAKVKNGIIIQDTGTGGGWPVSTDRMIWAIAAYQVYLTTGDKEWLEKIYKIISRSIESDLYTIFDSETGLVKGESSFLDWREQTYPKWMDPKDITESKCLGTNVVHAGTYRVLSEICKILGVEHQKYENHFYSIKAAINKYLWNSEKGYYNQFIYGRLFPVVSEKSETLGEALSVLFDVADERSISTIKNTPTTFYGTPVVYPQESKIPPYHNDAIWPFVEAYRMWAAKKVNNEEALLHSLASIIRASGLFLTNKENFVVESGSPVGTEINSDRQLWSVAGNLAIFYRIIFGMEFYGDKLILNPYIPKSISGVHTLDDFRIGNATYNITVSGVGNKIKSFKLDGIEINKSIIKYFENGKHSIEIELEEGTVNSGQNLVENYHTIKTPYVSSISGRLVWDEVEGAVIYEVYKNGKYADSTGELFYNLNETKIISEYQICAMDKNGIKSFFSEPIIIRISTTEIAWDVKLSSDIADNKTINIDVLEDGEYALSLYYANGSGPLNTDNKCALRSIKIDNSFIGCIVMPQRGINNWSNFGYSSTIKVNLNKGKHALTIYYDELNRNMNFNVNEAIIKSVRLIRLNHFEKEL